MRLRRPREGTNLIPWRTVAFSSLWILGLAVILTALGFSDYHPCLEGYGARGYCGDPDTGWQSTAGLRSSAWLSWVRLALGGRRTSGVSWPWLLASMFREPCENAGPQKGGYPPMTMEIDPLTSRPKSTSSFHLQGDCRGRALIVRVFVRHLR